MTVASALTQKWLDQNHTSRSTKPISASIAARNRASASSKKMRRGSGTSFGASAVSGGASGAVAIWFSMPVFAASFCAASRRLRSSLSCAARAALYSKTSRFSAAAAGSAAAIRPAPGRSSSARSAPCGSLASAAIEPRRGPMPKRCSASAEALASRIIAGVLSQGQRIMRGVRCRYPRNPANERDRPRCPPRPEAALGKTGAAADIYIYAYLRLSQVKRMHVNTPPTPELCNCLAIRQAARHVSQLYDRYLAPTGLRGTQFSILAKLRRLGPTTINALARDLVMDRTTLGRNIL